jgi:hypothetical protein
MLLRIYIQVWMLRPITVTCRLTPIHTCAYSRQQVKKPLHSRKAFGQKPNGSMEQFERGPDYRVNIHTGCWIWNGPRDAFGYGQTSEGQAHRISYTQHKGPIPQGLVIDHLCWNPSCINPAHLEAVTTQVNNFRRRTNKLTPDMVLEMRAYYNEHKDIASIAQLARRYNVSTNYAVRVCRSQHWDFRKLNRIKEPKRKPFVNKALDEYLRVRSEYMRMWGIPVDAKPPRPMGAKYCPRRKPSKRAGKQFLR